MAPVLPRDFRFASGNFRGAGQDVMKSILTDTVRIHGHQRALPADDFVGLPAEQPLRSAIPLHDAQVEIGCYDCNWRAAEDRTHELARLTKRGFDFVLLRHIVDQDEPRRTISERKRM